MNDAFEQALEQIEEEKGIPREEILSMIEAALASAFRKDYGDKDQNVVVEFDPQNMSSKIYDLKTVVGEVTDAQKEISLEDAKEIDSKYKVGDEIKTDITPKEGTNFGRIAAQTAKQVIIQRMREAERNIVFSEYKSKERTLQNGTVQRVEGDTVLVDLGKATGVLFPSEQIRGEKYQPGQRVKVLVLHVEPANKGPKITLSRSHPDMVRKLFELEVPEIYSGAVEIKAIAREAGSRTKIAVFSNQDGIDPIGACVGQRGTRVQTVMNELGGEKIDIIEWNDDPIKLIANALSPAKILNVQLDMEEKSARVGVLEDQLSLVIGKSGQNVRLAARLTGWKIDINGEKVSPEGEVEKGESEVVAESEHIESSGAGASETAQENAPETPETAEISETSAPKDSGF